MNVPSVETHPTLRQLTRSVLTIPFAKGAVRRAAEIRNPEATGFAKKQEAGLQLARGRNCAGSTRQLHSSDAGR